MAGTHALDLDLDRALDHPPTRDLDRPLHPSSACCCDFLRQCIRTLARLAPGTS